MPSEPVDLKSAVFKLNSGHDMPALGLGCWMGKPGGGEAVETMCKTALKLGYRHIDTADGYQNEEYVGKAIKESGVPRSEIFVTTKLSNGEHGRVREALEKSLKKLDCEYIDLFLIHWPQAAGPDGKTLQPEQSPTYVETWKSMEQLLDTGKVRSIGVSNFSIKTLEVLLPQARVVPAVNQVQLHPCLPDNPLLEYCAKKGIHVTAWGPLGRSNSPFFSDLTVQKIAEKNQLTPAQVILSWGYQRGTSVIPKSEKEARLKENMHLVHLDEEDFAAIDNLHKQPGMHRQLTESPNFDIEKGVVFGWTVEQLGWNWDKKGEWVE